jgi:hypothetical protein
VRCVQDGRVNLQIPAAAAIVQAPQNDVVPQPMRDVNRVNPAFAELGNIYEAAGLFGVALKLKA